MHPDFPVILPGVDLPLGQTSDVAARRTRKISRPAHHGTPGTNIGVSWDGPCFLQRAENRTAEVKGADLFHHIIGLESAHGRYDCSEP